MARQPHRGELRDYTDDFLVDDGPGPSGRGRPAQPQETDAHRVAQRQKQIDFGKNTIGYERYARTVPKHKRRRGDPQTPNPAQQQSKRSFDAQVRQWRRQLHDWDINEGEAAHVFTRDSDIQSSQEGPSSAPDQAYDAALGEEADPTTAPCLESRKRPLLQQANHDNSKRQHLQKAGQEPHPRSGTSGSGGREESLPKTSSSWGEQQNRMEAAARADLFQDWDDDVVL